MKAIENKSNEMMFEILEGYLQKLREEYEVIDYQKGIEILMAVKNEFTATSETNKKEKKEKKKKLEVPSNNKYANCKAGELRDRCKELGIPAKRGKDEMIYSILEHEQNNEKPADEIEEYEEEPEQEQEE
tara:strand:- start:262 stop:651 length:390 start_codon:yes stop_codon:yes gene_type:complete